MKTDRPTEPEKKYVLNLTFLGTGQHRDHPDPSYYNILVDAHNYAKQDANQTAYLIDGIGGEMKLSSKDKHPMLGTYKPVISYNAETGQIEAQKIKIPSQSFTAARALATGKGYKDAIDEAIAVVETLIKAGKNPLKINICGYSRGADTALRFSNMLANSGITGLDKLPIEINILAIDPVPGTLPLN